MMVVQFVERAVALARERRVGSWQEEGVEQGPQVDSQQFSRVLSLIERYQHY